MPRLNTQQKRYAVNRFFIKHKSKHYAANSTFKKMSFYRVLYNYFLDIL